MGFASTCCSKFSGGIELVEEGEDVLTEIEISARCMAIARYSAFVGVLLERVAADTEVVAGFFDRVPLSVTYFRS